MIDSSQSTSTRPYLLRALYEWCADNGLTPYVAAYVDDSVKVPREHVKNNEIVLNISMDATSHLQIGNDVLQFKARFGGVAREIVVPIDHIIAIYARENGQGMAFPVPQTVPPRGEVKDSPAAERRSSLRPVSLPGTASQAAAPEPSNPLLQPSIEPAKEPAKIVKLKAAPESVKKVREDDPTEPTPPPAGAGKSVGRPSLTRVK
ncbi:ClpXP protease specificity-enhancing factor [Variovorax sp. PCZ-1]|uniref:ClpXP protease specificity-enhancing factor n=1 Tax=Variovorax sp. PCZ-1 TaxID=2835533 RepID=UPI001BCD6615|nr:ClpXP protease specificity-enhancing factor [Variovorax sp. PCZ-1]MBS7807992.1 ClpXP protease specificity-enhancing factor [Variovorax sp. PCZ-1]